MSATAIILEFPSAIKTFRAIGWNGKIHDECSTTAFRRAAVNPDPEKFVEIDDNEMKSARGSYPSRLWIETANSQTVEVWGWL